MIGPARGEVISRVWLLYNAEPRVTYWVAFDHQHLVNLFSSYVVLPQSDA